MYRRTVLRYVAKLLGAFPYLAQSAQILSVDFPQDQGPALHNLAYIVLPSSLGIKGCDEIAERFIRYVKEYRPGADTDHGYGVTHVRPKPPSPVQTYLQQLHTFPSPLTRAAVEQALAEAKIQELPRTPDGKNVIADLMSFYFRSSDANDLCYRAAVGRDKCRGLSGSENPPTPLQEPA
jgi:hypothetical protein